MNEVPSRNMACMMIDTRIHFIQPLKKRIVREVGYGLSLEGASFADLVEMGIVYAATLSTIRKMLSSKTTAVPPIAATCVVRPLTKRPIRSALPATQMR
jgi:hypothetical protein